MTDCKRDNCYHPAVTGSNECDRHTNQATRVREYKLTSKRMQDRLDQLMESEQAASLKSEVMLAQMLLEDRYAALGPNPSPVEIVAAHGSINDSLRTIEKLVSSMHKHDLSTDEVLTKTAAYRLVGQIVDVLCSKLEIFEDHAEYPTLVDGIESELLLLVDMASNKEEE